MNINKRKNLKHKWNFTASTAITEPGDRKRADVGTEPGSPAPRHTRYQVFKLISFFLPFFPRFSVFSIALVTYRTTQHRMMTTNIHTDGGIRTHCPRNQADKTHASDRATTENQLSYDGELKENFLYWTCKVTVKKVENKIITNSGMSIPNILARESEEGPLPYCKTGAQSDGNGSPCEMNPITSKSRPSLQNSNI
jgi:hypothetical protein